MLIFGYINIYTCVFRRVDIWVYVKLYKIIIIYLYSILFLTSEVRDFFITLRRELNLNKRKLNKMRDLAWLKLIIFYFETMLKYKVTIVL